MDNERKTTRTASKNGKYDLITYLLEQNKNQPEEIRLKPDEMIEKIRELTHQEALELFPRDNQALMEKLMTYVKQNKVKIKESGLFFPGRKQIQVDKRSLLHELHFHLKEQDRSLSEFGLKIRQERQKKEPEKPKDVIDWAREILS
jgi:hypothetical protein